MLTYQVDPDIERWGLHHLLDGCSIVNSSSHGSITQYNADFSEVVPVKEDYVQEKDNVENDEIIARALQEELSRVAEAEASGILDDQVGQSSILSQDWCGSSQRHLSYDHSNIHDGPDGKAEPTLCAGHEETSPNTEDLAQLEISDEYILDSELGRRLDQMIPIPHVPKVNGDMPTADEATSDHQRLLDRLKLYELAELRVQGDGNCQFRALSDQFYRSPEHHKIVRQQVVHQLKSRPELYEGYVPMSYGDYLKKISRTGEWGDHVTLQACADSYGVKIFVLTSFKETCYIEILPHVEKSKRVIFLSFWAEVHYNSIYPEGEYPVLESKKKKKWWML
uniref:ubiquitinyl hydrolase 1 n=1 Tax=Kalanchoe fedtschenkoi TaxID=63787 RepID=A0A7N0T6T9_KALFE